MRLVAVMWIASAMGCGVGPPADEDAGLVDASPPDAAVQDAGDDGGIDGGRDVDAATGGDAGVDAEPCDCEATSPCLMGSCETGACIEAPVANGTLCGEGDDQVCVDGACVGRGCGDGYREPGSSPSREGCDDGNLENGDACSSTCEPTAMLVEASSTGDYDAMATRGAPSIGVAGSGAVLIVWSEAGLDTGRIRAQRLTRGGTPEGSPITLDPSIFVPPQADPTVAGLAAGGWVVVWEANRGTTKDVVFRIVRPDGTAAAEQRANVEIDGIQHEARVAATTDGFVIVWTDAAERSDDLLTGVRARRFSSIGAAMGGEILVATSRDDREERPAVAANGDEWLVIWQRTQLGIGGGTTAYLRRFMGSTPLDATDVQAGPESGRAFVVTALESGDWAAAWFETTDVYARVIDDASPAFDPADTLAVAAEPGHPERHQAIAPLEGGDFLVAWEDDDGPSHIAFASSPGAMLAPEAMDLATRLEDGESHVSVAASPDGVWFVWSGFEWGTGALGVGAYHLPID